MVLEVGSRHPDRTDHRHPEFFHEPSSPWDGHLLGSFGLGHDAVIASVPVEPDLPTPCRVPGFRPPERMHGCTARFAQAFPE